MPAASRGRPPGSKSKPWADALRQAAMELGADRKTMLLAAARQCVAAAVAGDIQAQKELGDRLDGKAHQSMDMNHNVSESFARLLDAISNGKTAELADGLAEEPEQSASLRDGGVAGNA